MFLPHRLPAVFICKAPPTVHFPAALAQAAGVLRAALPGGAACAAKQHHTSGCSDRPALLGRCPVLAALLESPVLSPLWRQLLDSGAGSSDGSDALTGLDVPGLLFDSVVDTFEVRWQHLTVLGFGNQPVYG